MAIRTHETGVEVLLEKDIAPEQRTHETGVEVLLEKGIEPVVGRLGISGGVSDLVMVGVEPDAVEYAWVNTGFDDEAETAEYVHLNTTENAEAVVGRLALGGGTNEAVLVGYTIGSAVVSGTADAGEDATITWDETPTGTRVDFEVFRRSPSTGERFDPEADSAARIADGIDALEYVDADLDAGDYDWQVFARVERD